MKSKGRYTERMFQLDPHTFGMDETRQYSQTTNEKGEVYFQTDGPVWLHFHGAICTDPDYPDQTQEHSSDPDY